MQSLYEMFSTDPEVKAHKYEHYFPVYERYLEPYRNRPVSMLEIGVDRGGSLKLWKNYLGPHAKIHGIDIKPECASYAEQNVEVYIGSQADRSFLDEILKKMPPLDIVLDDGSHRASHQVTSFETIYPRMKSDGVYIVEDLQTSYWPRFGRRFFHRGRFYRNGFVDFARAKVHALNSFHHDEKSFGLFGIPRDERSIEAAADPFARLTRSISFYDSMVVFERAETPEPLRIRKE